MENLKKAVHNERKSSSQTLNWKAYLFTIHMRMDWHRIHNIFTVEKKAACKNLHVVSITYPLLIVFIARGKDAFGHPPAIPMEPTHTPGSNRDGEISIRHCSIFGICIHFNWDAKFRLGSLKKEKANRESTNITLDEMK